MAQCSNAELSTRKGPEATKTTPSQQLSPGFDTELQARNCITPDIQDDLFAEASPRLRAALDDEASMPAPSQDGPPSLETTAPATAISKSLTIRLYTSHFLSTWNSRLFEAAVVYFLAAIFPNTLLPISVYALVRNAAAIVLTVPVGTWIDRANRLTILRTSILGQRISVAASCTLFWAMLRAPGLTGQTTHGLFAATVVLACIEKVLAGVNLVAVERDWVVVITEGNETARRTMNARMRRIDLFCKLLGPLAVALIATASVPVAVYITLGMNLASVFVEYICVERVYRMVPALHRQINAPPSSQVDTVGHGPPDASQTQSRAKLDTLCGMASQALMIPALRLYFSHPAAIPSFALSLLYLTVLAFSGQMLTFLLASNINQWQVGVIRAVSTVFELSATWITPRLTRHIGVLRTGLWSINWQMTWLAAGLTWFLYFHHHTTYPSTSPLPAAGLAAAVALSRAGLWGFDLSAQNIVQDEVEGDRRGLFSSVEAAIQNLFDLLAWALTIIWPDPVSFQWPVIISVVAVYAAGGLYAYFLRERRGHLVHPPRCLRPKVDDQS